MMRRHLEGEALFRSGLAFGPADVASLGIAVQVLIRQPTLFCLLAIFQPITFRLLALFLGAKCKRYLLHPVWQSALVLEHAIPPLVREALLVEKLEKLVEPVCDYHLLAANLKPTYFFHHFPSEAAQNGCAS
jgi:hypothetical protein